MKRLLASTAIATSLLAGCAHAQFGAGGATQLVPASGGGSCAGIALQVAFSGATQNCSNATAFGSAAALPGYTSTPGTLTGGSASTALDASGVLHDFTTGQLRTTTAGVTTEPSGSSNLILHSQDGQTTGGAYWGCFNSTFTANTTAAPDGTTTATTYNNTGAGGSCSNNNGGGVAQTASATYTDSVFFKLGTDTVANLRAFDGTNSAGATFTPSTGACAVNINTGYSGVSCSLVQLGSTAWWRGSVTYTSPATGGLFTKDGIFNANSATLFVWGFQHQTGVAATSYLPTTTVASALSADTLTVTCTSCTTDFGSSYFGVGTQQNTYFAPTSTVAIGGATLTSGQPIQYINVQATRPVPLQASTIGYGTNTFSTPSFTTSNVDQACAYASGKQWYNMNFFGITCPNSTGTISGGVLSITGNQVASYGFTTAGSLGGSNWVGTAFGSGFYAEAAFTYDPSAINTGDGWAAWWSMSLEHLANLAGQQWTGQVAGYTSYSEPDFFEADGAAGLGQSSLHHWYGTGTCSGSSNCIYSNNAFMTYLTPSAVQVHYWGALWVPATVSTNGYIQMYLDGVKRGPPVSWSQYVAASDSPPPSGSTPWAFGVVDVNHLVLFLSAGTNTPINVNSVNVWQINGSGNVIH